MLAALKDKCLQYVVWEGINSSYPSWFYEYVVDEIYEDEFRYSYFTSPDSGGEVYYEVYDEYGFANTMYLTESVSVFLLSRKGKIMLIDIDMFKKIFVVFNNRYCAIEDKCLYYYMSSENGPAYGVMPDWFMKQVAYGFVHRQYGTWYYISEKDEIAMSPSCVFLWNGRDDSDLFYMETEVFKELFHYKRYP